MLTEEDKNFMIEILATELGASGMPRQDLVAPFYDTEFAAELTQGGTPRILATDAIRLCLRDAWNHDPTWLELIITTFELTTIDAKVAEIWERSKHKPPAAPNPLDNYVLFNGSPFVNRMPLRTKVGRLNNSATNMQPILVVTGLTQSGKSYSHNFIDHFSNHSASIFVYKYEFDNDLGLEIGPERVATDLVAKMGRSLDKRPPLETNLKLFSRQLALWVLNEAAQTAAQHWFVLDNFSGDRLRQDTKDFILALTDIVTTGIFQKRCRIILMGFDSALLTVDQAQFDEEIIAPCTLPDIHKVIAEILAVSNSPLDTGTVTSFVTDNLPSGETKMLELNARLRALFVGITSLIEILANIQGVNFQEVLMNMLKDLPAGKGKVIELKKRLQTLRESTNEMP
jgi:hypothetical protein